MRIAERLSGGKPAATPRSQRNDFDLDQILATLHRQVVDHLDIVTIRELDATELSNRVDAIVDQLLQQQQWTLAASRRERVVSAIVDEIVGFGPLEPLLADRTVSDILVNTASRVYVEREGKLERTAVRFRDNAHLMSIINRIVARVGRRIDEASPMVDARLPDGSRVNAVIPPLAIDGPLLSIRRFGTGPTRLEDLVASGTMSPAMLAYLRCAVHARCNIVVSGGTGSGKTTLLNALSGLIPHGERIITIEDAAELCLQQDHVGRMETRPPNIEGRGEVTVRDLVRNALRMRPDRIIVGEVRSAEVLDMIQAMNTGHDGSMTTVHANSPQEAITRLKAMLAMGHTQLSEALMLEMIAQSIHVVVHLARHTDGARRVTAIAEVGDDGRTTPLFEFVPTWSGDDGTLRGEFRKSNETGLLRRFRAAGVVPAADQGVAQ